MEPQSLSDQLRAGFLQAVRPDVIASLAPKDQEVCGVGVADLPAAGRVGVPQQERDRIWIAVLVRYRTRKQARALWAPVILEMLAPALVQQLAQLRALTPFLDEEDLNQQMLLAALEAAISIPLRGRRRLIELRLARRAATAIRRTLRYEARRGKWSLPVDQRQVDRRAVEGWHASEAESIYDRRRKRSAGRGSIRNGYGRDRDA